MATAGTSSATILDPSTLPQVSFAHADDLLNNAAQLRTNAEILKAHAKETEDNAKQLEDFAAELQASAETLREYIQAKLDTTLEYHSDVLRQFLLTSANEEELKRLKISVEEGRSCVHQITNLDNQLLQFKSANLEPSHPSEGNSSCELSQFENSAASSTRILPPNWPSPRAPSAPVGGMFSWRYRINNLLRRRVADIDHPSSASPIQSQTRGKSVEAQKEINSSSGKDETHDGHEYKMRNIVEATSNQSDIPVEPVSAEALPNEIALGPSEDVILEMKTNGQTWSKKKRKRKNLQAECNIIPSQDIHQGYVEEDFITLNSPKTDASASKKLKRKIASLAIPISDAERRKEVEQQRLIFFNEREALARYRKLFFDWKGPNEDKVGNAKKMLKKEFKSEIERHNEMSSKEKSELIAYTMRQINMMVKREHEGSDKKTTNTMMRREQEGTNTDKDSMAMRESEHAADAQRVECYNTELSDESVNESTWP